MNITEKWNALLEKIKQLLNKEMADEVADMEENSPEAVERIGETGKPAKNVTLPEDEKDGRSAKVSDGASDGEEHPEELQKRKGPMNEQPDVSWLEDPEIRNARIAAQASQTKVKEDPSVHEFRRTLNEQAYSEDMKFFR